MKVIYKDDKYYKLELTEYGFKIYGPYDTVEETEVNSNSIILLGSALKIKLQGLSDKWKYQ